MLLIVNLSANQAVLPIGILEQCDTLLVSIGFKKEVHSVIKPGREFCTTYTGPNTSKNRIEEILMPLAEKNQINLSIELEESVKFP